MYTRCPACRSVFAIAALQLRTRQGQVHCDLCGTPFNALLYLMDELPEEERKSTEEKPSSDPDVSRELPAEQKKREDSSTLLPENQTQQVPWSLRGGMTTRLGFGDKRQAAFGFGIFLLFIILLGQYTWFHATEVLQRFPGSRPWMEMFCQGTGCKVPMQRDPERVRIINRDVRVHPKYEGALLVSARLVNTLPITQPFPLMRFTLFNVSGGIIATRTFLPSEYLDDDIDLAAGMRAYRPIQVVLDVLAQEEAAVSFEFTFL